MVIKRTFHGFFTLLLAQACSGKEVDSGNPVLESTPTWQIIESEDPRGAWLRTFSTSDTTWIVGGQPNVGAILHGNPTDGFVNFALPADTPLLNWADGTDDNLWVGGLYGTILHWNGSVWTDHSQAIDEAIWGLSVVGDEVIAVGGASRWGGDQGIVLHWDGDTWTSLNVPTELASANNFFKVTHDGERYWIIGVAGSAFHGNPGSWTPVPTGITQDLITVVSPETGKVEIVGGRGTGIYIKGNVDSLTVEPPLIAGINGIAVTDQQRLLVGELGYGLLIDDTTQTEITAVTTHILHAAALNSDATSWIAVGGNLATSEDTYEGSILTMEVQP